MQTKTILGMLLLVFLFSQLSYSQVQCVSLNGNNIKSYIANTGVFDQNRVSDTAGFEWPKGSGKFAIYTAGINIAGYQSGIFTMSSASFKGEYLSGYCIAGTPHTNSYFHLYKVSRGDNMSNPDWANWGLMVPYGAPFVDMNNNGTYEPAIDTPGVKGAAQTIFVCLTDGFSSLHDPNEGFGGGTPPLFAELHMIAWCYNTATLNDVQFIKWTIINKSTQIWDSTIFSIFADPDIGNGYNDYAGVDTTRKLGYCYNATNYDSIYGYNPPAAGMALLRGAIRKNVIPNISLGLSSFNSLTNPNGSTIMCETDPRGETQGAYLMMSGYKKDSTCWLNPLTIVNGTRKTKFCFPGDPETGIDWTELIWSYSNCNKDTTNANYALRIPGDRRFLLNSGKVQVNPGDTQTIVISQLIASGNSNKNSVTRLKILADTARAFYNRTFIILIKDPSSVIPGEFKLYQNYPNPFNPVTKIKFDITRNIIQGESGNFVTLKVYDILGKEITTLVNEQLQPGSYEVTFDGSNQPSGVYYYRLSTGRFTDTKKLLLIK